MRRYFVIVLLFAFLLLIYFPGLALAGKIKGTVKVKGLRSPANVLIYLTKAPSGSMDLSKTNFVMDQLNLEFRPHVLPVLVGSTVQFPNNDQVDHNIFSMSRTKKFNLGICDYRWENPYQKGFVKKKNFGEIDIAKADDGVLVLVATLRSSESPEAAVLLRKNIQFPVVY